MVIEDYIRALWFWADKGEQVIVDPAIYIFLLDLLARNGRFHRLHQLLLNRVFSDSQDVACKLLKYSDIYPPALQLCIDMFKRLEDYDQIVEVFLAKRKLSEGLKCIQLYADKMKQLDKLKDLMLQEAARSDSVMLQLTKNFFEAKLYLSK